MKLEDEAATVNCESCRYWRRGTSTPTGPVGDPATTYIEATSGECRRYPPQMVAYSTRPPFGIGEWPKTMTRDYCGEWDADCET